MPNTTKLVNLALRNKIVIEKLQSVKKVRDSERVQNALENRRSCKTEENMTQELYC